MGFFYTRVSSFSSHNIIQVTNSHPSDSEMLIRKDQAAPKRDPIVVSIAVASCVLSAVCVIMIACIIPTLNNIKDKQSDMSYSLSVMLLLLDNVLVTYAFSPVLLPSGQLRMKLLGTTRKIEEPAGCLFYLAYQSTYHL